MDAPWGWGLPGLKLSASQVAAELKVRLSPSALAELVKNFNEDSLEAGVFIMATPLYEEMVKTGVIRCVERDGEPTIIFHPAVRAAWRCGYLV